MALGAGATLYLPHREERRSQNAFFEYLARNAITHATLPPALFQGASDAGRCAGLRTVVLAGEAPSATLVKAFGPQTAVFNAYGPTETTVWATTWLRPAGFDDPVVPIGRPIANARIYVLDDHRRPVPVGAVGEIYIGGAGVARGYLDQPELTAARFFEDPFAGDAGGRLYRTGDLARYRADGNLEFLGRSDHQVKLRGYRIELGEIEARLRAHPAVREAVVVARENEMGDKRLVAYVTARPGEVVDAAALREHLGRQLPDYMVPAAVVRMKELPLTSNGKVDRKALPVPGEDAVAIRAYEPPQGDVETGLAEIWQSLLAVPRVGRHDHFFDLGGHSLLVTQLAARIRKEFFVDVSVSALFQRPHLSTLSDFVLSLQAEKFLGENVNALREALASLSEDQLRSILAEDSAHD